MCPAPNTPSADALPADIARELALYREVFDEIPNVILLKDEQGNFLLCNQTVARLYGTTPKAMVGKHDGDFGVPPEMAEFFRQNVLGIMARGETEIVFEDSRDAQSGEIRHFKSIKRPFKDAEGRNQILVIAIDITDVVRAQQRTADSERRLQEVMAATREGIWDWDLQSGRVIHNPQWYSILGFAEGEIEDSIEVFSRSLHPDDQPLVWCRIQALIKGTTPDYYSEHRMLRKDGSVIWVRDRGRIVERDAAGRPLRLIGAYADITERKDAEEALRQSEARLNLALSGAGMATWDWYIPGGALVFNARWAEIQGYAPEELAPHIESWESRIFPDDQPLVRKRLQRHFRGDSPAYDSVHRLRHKAGHWVWVQAWGKVVEWSEAGKPLRVIGTAIDVTERKAAEEKIQQLAFYDPLTGLPNRRLLLERLQQALSAHARSQLQGALLFIDLDNFKTLNDTLGHDQGDLLLQQVAERLATCVRKGDTVARLGGDEFVVMLEGLNTPRSEAAHQAEVVGTMILATLNRNYRLRGHDYHSTPSIGITLFSDQPGCLDELLKQADLAMYQAKAAGRNTLRFFDQAMQSVVNAHALLEKELRQGVRMGQFVLYYQAQISDCDRLGGAEVLVRWQHPGRGLVTPNNFIPRAEETGLILPLGQWVLESACSCLAAWAGEAATAALTLAVNVSVQQLRQPDFVPQVLNTLARSGADPHKLKLELTESLLMDNVEDSIAKMTALKARGVHFALDDFGTGYSSLTYLKRLPLEKLKIDRSFVRDVLTDPNDAAIARTIMALARSLGLGVIAEGVETEAQRDFLFHQGCHAYQGFLFSRPLPREGFEDFARQALLREGQAGARSAPPPAPTAIPRYRKSWRNPALRVG